MSMSTKHFKVSEVTEGYYNNEPVIFFSLYEWNEDDEVWSFYSRYCAPDKTNREELIDYALSKEI